MLIDGLTVPLGFVDELGFALLLGFIDIVLLGFTVVLGLILIVVLLDVLGLLLGFIDIVVDVEVLGFVLVLLLGLIDVVDDIVGLGVGVGVGVGVTEIVGGGTVPLGLGEGEGLVCGGQFGIHIGMKNGLLGLAGFGTNIPGSVCGVWLGLVPGNGVAGGAVGDGQVVVPAPANTPVTPFNIGYTP